MFKISIHSIIMHKWGEESHYDIQCEYDVDYQLDYACDLDCNVDLETYCERKQQELHLKSNKKNQLPPDIELWLEWIYN